MRKITLTCFQFSFSVLSGFICQGLGILFEAARLVSIQKLLHGMKMDPLVSLYYFAPVCATLNALLIPIYEGSTPFYLVWDRLGPLIMLTNASCAFCLNIAVVFLIGCASSLVLTLSGVIKDILLVVGSVVIMGSTVTFLQMIGYAIALSKFENLFLFFFQKITYSPAIYSFYSGTSRFQDKS